MLLAGMLSIIIIHNILMVLFQHILTNVPGAGDSVAAVDFFCTCFINSNNSIIINRILW
jgi:hypothetical protein